VQQLCRDQTAIHDRIKQLEGLRRELDSAREEAERLATDARLEYPAVEQHHAKWKDEYEPAFKAVERKLLVLQALERLRRLEKEEGRLQDHVDKVKRVQELLRHKREEIAELRAPLREEWRTFQKNVTDLQVVLAQAEASAIRVVFDLQDKHLGITATPEAHHTSGGEEFLLTAPTVFTIPRVGTVSVRGGGTSLEALDERAKELQHEIQETLDRFRTSDAQSLSDLHQQHIDLEGDIQQLQERLQDLAEEEEKPEGELSRVRRGIAEESAKVEDAPEAWKRWGGQNLRREVEELEEEKARIIANIEEEQKHEEGARRAHLDGVKKAQEASNRVVELQSQIRTLEQENAKVLTAYATLDHLGSLIEQAEEALRRAREDLAALMQDYEQRVVMPKKLYRQAEERVDRLKEQLGQLKEKIVDRNARIEAATALGLYSQTADLEASLEAKRRRLANVTRRAEAARLLYRMVGAHRREQSAALAGPVAALVNRWLRLLTDEAYDVVQLNEELLPQAVRSSRYGAPLPMDSLSYGTHEQVIVLLRLAIGVLLGETESQLVVIDDRLVNADALRMKRLCLIFEEVVQHACQVVVATCNDTPYAGIRGHIIRVPFDGRGS
jgi:DNA repair protein SbcC/Rad50